MRIGPTLPGPTLPGAPAPAGPGAPAPEDAARQFEEVLARQFVAVMTKGLFQSNLSGEGGPGWMEGQSDLQRDALTDALTKHLVSSGGLGLSELLARQWRRGPGAEAPPQIIPPAAENEL